jgi:hypothetical protein
VINVRNFFQKLTDKSERQLYVTIIVAYTVFSLIILLVFVPTSLVISESGYSTSNLQEATTSQDVDEILSAWSEVKPIIYLQYLADYIFLLSGLIGNSAIFVLLGKKIKEKGNILLAFVGFLSVFLSRGLDALENTLTLVLIVFPDSYPEFILNILPFIPRIKFGFVAIVYSLILVTLVYYLILKWKQRNR